MFRYALRNVLHYRRKYAVSFLLILCVSAILALSLFCRAGLMGQAYRYARHLGDIQIYFNAAELEKLESGPLGAEQAHDEILAWIGKKLETEKLVSISAAFGKIYTASAFNDIVAARIGPVAAFESFVLIAGKEPGEGEVLMPSALAKDYPIGQSLSFAYMDSDQILNSLRLRVSGHYLASQWFEGFMLFSDSGFTELDSGKVDNNFFISLPDSLRKNILLGKDDFEAIKTGFKADFAAYGDAVTIADMANQNYDSAKELITFFELIIFIFVAVLILISLITIVNVLYLALMDRIRVLASFMAFGMGRGRLILTIAAEMLCFSALASALGIGLALIASGIIPSYRFTLDNYTLIMLLGGQRTMQPLPSWGSALISLGICCFFPFITALLALRRILRGSLASLLDFKK